MNCEFCNKVLSNKYTLLNHQRTTKSCLEAQRELGIETECNLIKCLYCGLSMSQENKSRHDANCKVKKNVSDLINSKDSKIQELEKQLCEKEYEIKTMESELAIYKDILSRNQSCIEEALKQPKTTNNTTTNNTLNMMSPFDLNKEEFEKCVSVSFTESHMMDGQRGVARFAVDNLLRDENGQLKYVCTDPSRHIYKFKTKDGEMQRDVKAQKLTLALSESISRESHTLTKECMARNSDNESWERYTDNFKDINDMKNDNGDFRNELSSLITIK